MRVVQAVEYALRALTVLAMQPDGTRLPAGELAESAGLPKRFVEQQFTALARAGIVKCRRGSAGGCGLARPAAAISAKDVIEAVQGLVLDVPRQPGIASTEMWLHAASLLEESLSMVSLAQLAARQRELDADRVPMYHI